MLNTALTGDYHLISKSPFDKIRGSILGQISLALVDTSADPVGAVNAWTVYLESLQKGYPAIKPILIAIPALRDMAYQLIRSGLVYDVVSKPLDIEELGLTLQRGQYLSLLESELSILELAELHQKIQRHVARVYRQIQECSR